MKIRNLFATLLALCFASCAAQYSSITPSAVNQIRPGITTQADLLQLFGPPDTQLSTVQGVTSLVWFRSLGPEPAGYLPVFGELFGGLELKVQQLSVMIGRSGRVTSYTIYGSNGMLKTERTHHGTLEDKDFRK